MGINASRYDGAITPGGEWTQDAGGRWARGELRHDAARVLAALIDARRERDAAYAARTSHEQMLRERDSELAAARAENKALLATLGAGEVDHA